MGQKTITSSVSQAARITRFVVKIISTKDRVLYLFVGILFCVLTTRMFSITLFQRLWGIVSITCTVTIGPLYVLNANDNRNIIDGRTNRVVVACSEIVKRFHVMNASL